MECVKKENDALRINSEGSLEAIPSPIWVNRLMRKGAFCIANQQKKITASMHFQTAGTQTLKHSVGDRYFKM